MSTQYSYKAHLDEIYDLLSRAYEEADRLSHYLEDEDEATDSISHLVDAAKNLTDAALDEIDAARDAQGKS